MIFQKIALEGAFIIDIQKIEDERGFFAEGWKQSEAEAQGIQPVFNRTNISYNRIKGTLRGMHSQRSPFSEIKLVRCIQGALYDVIVDIRPGSSTYAQWFGVTLTMANHRMLYVPEGFLHGFQTLEDDTTVFYQVAGNYQPKAELGAKYDDAAFDILWPEVESRLLSHKDQNWPAFEPEQ